LGSSYGSDNIEGWDCFQMDCEGHLVSFNFYRSNFHLSNESIEHLSTFHHLRNLEIISFTNINQSVTNFSLLSNLKNLSINCEREFNDPELFFNDIGLFTNLLSLDLCSNYGFENCKFDSFPFSSIYISYFIRSYDSSFLLF